MYEYYDMILASKYYDMILASICIILTLSFILYLLLQSSAVMISGGFICFGIILHTMFAKSDFDEHKGMIQ